MKEYTQKKLRELLIWDFFAQAVFFICVYFIWRIDDPCLAEQIIFGLGAFTSGISMFLLWITKPIWWGELHES